MSYFATLYPTAVLQPGVWVEWGLSGFHFVTHWIPWVYVLLCSGGFLLFGWGYLVGKRDPITFALRAPRKPVSRLRRALVHTSIILLFVILIEAVNLLAASLTSFNAAMSVLERLSLIASAVIAFPIMMLFAMDHLYSVLE